MLKIGLEHLTDTTGVVRGYNEVKDFVSMCNYKFSKVHIFGDVKTDYLQYTLLTNNEIRIYGN